MSKIERSAQSADGRASVTADSRVRRAYARPTLIVYGTIRELTRSTGTHTGTDSTMMNMTSDRALKDNLVRVGDHPLGFGLYLFDYKSPILHGCGRQFGVMADEVEAVLPQAVSVHAAGHKVVDYDMLGIVRGQA